MKTPNYVFDDELYHHGIPGQRWFHRRFQNEDGSWTPAGRERYGKGDDIKAKTKAKYDTQKYKADIKSKAQKEKDIRTAKEERNRIRQQAKTERLARREQAKIEGQGRPTNLLNKTKNMSDQDLQSAINRLKLEAEYNKSYAIASKPNSMLAKADSFFEGPTGKVVRDIAVATIPQVANTAATKVLESKLKYANELDREKMRADINKVNAEAESKKATADKAKAEADTKTAEAEAKRAEIARDDKNAEAKNERLNKLVDAKNERFGKRLDADIALKKQEGNLRVVQAKHESRRADVQQKHDIEMNRAEMLGYRDQANNLVTGKFQERANREIGNTYEHASKIKQAEADAELGRELVKARYNDISFLAAQGKTEEARNLSRLFSNTKINDWQVTNTIEAKYESTATKKETSKPVSAIDTKTNLNSYLRKNESNGIPSSKESAIRSAQGSAEEIAKRYGVSISSVYAIKGR